MYCSHVFCACSLSGHGSPDVQLCFGLKPAEEDDLFVGSVHARVDVHGLAAGGVEGDLRWISAAFLSKSEDVLHFGVHEAEILLQLLF